MPRMPLDGMEDPKVCSECGKVGMHYWNKYVCINRACDNFKQGVQKTGSQ